MSSRKRAALLQPEFVSDLTYWVRNDGSVAIKILALMDATLSDPFAGMGKPEPLKHQLSGCWSRRISQEHRLVYRIAGTSVEFLMCRYHY